MPFQFKLPEFDDPLMKEVSVTVSMGEASKFMVFDAKSLTFKVLPDALTEIVQIGSYQIRVFLSGDPADGWETARVNEYTFNVVVNPRFVPPLITDEVEEEESEEPSEKKKINALIESISMTGEMTIRFTESLLVPAQWADLAEQLEAGEYNETIHKYLELAVLTSSE